MIETRLKYDLMPEVTELPLAFLLAAKSLHRCS